MDHFRTLGVTQSDLPVRLALDPEQKLSDEQFLAMLVGRNVSHKLGTDVRLDMGLPFVAADFGRRSVDPTLWQWKVLLSYKWKQQGHITLLESVAVLDSARPLEEVDTDGRGDKQEGDPHGGQPGGCGDPGKGTQLRQDDAEPTPPDHCAPARLQCAPPRGLGED